MKKTISTAERRHQDYLRRKALIVGKAYMLKLMKLRSKEVKRCLNICKESAPDQWCNILVNTLRESYLYDWYSGLYIDCGADQAKSTMRDLTKGKADDAFIDGAFASTMKAYAGQTAGSRIVIVKGTLLEDLQKIVRKHMAADINAGVEKLTQLIYADFSQNLLPWECRRIAQTESMISMAVGSDMAAQTLDVAFTKQWCISGVGNTRESHYALDGEVVEANEMFVLENCEMAYPHDQSTNPPPEEIINCACCCIRRPK